MAHSYHHAVSSARKWGGTPGDYQSIHDWLDGSKLIVADFRHHDHQLRRTDRAGADDRGAAHHGGSRAHSELRRLGAPHPT